MFITCPLWTIAQSRLQPQKTVVEKAHDKQLKLEEFSPTKNAFFKVKAFSIEAPIVNKTHHWFLQILTQDNFYVNFGTAEVISGYLKSDPNIPFKFMAPVMALCNEGKYIVGYSKLSIPGIYVLKVQIDNFGVKDEIEIELEILNNQRENSSLVN